jgi:hypothetical protein
VTIRPFKATLFNAAKLAATIVAIAVSFFLACLAVLELTEVSLEDL